MKRKHVFVLIGAVPIIVISLLYGYAYWGLRHDVVPITRDDRAKLASDLHVLDALAESIRHQKSHFHVVDLGSVGDPKKELELREFRTAVNLFQVEFGKLPRDPRDLSQLVSRAGTHQIEKEYDRFAHECHIIVLENAAFILDCDHWPVPDHPQLIKLVQSFDPDKERFYRVDHSILMYVPPPA